MPTAIQPEEEDDDWSDFTAAGAVDFTSDRATVDRNPTESPSRSDNATVRWAKPGGAIPLSIFGEEETDDVEVVEGSGQDDPRVADGKDEVRRDVKPVDVKDLIVNLYGREGNASSPRVSKTESEFDTNGEVSGRDWEIGGGISGGGGDEVVDEDDEWEFRAAPEEMTAEIEKFDSKGVVQGGLDLTSSRTFMSWDALSFEANGHPKFNLFITSANGHGIDSPTKEEDGDGDEGWEFQDARLASHYNGNMNNGVVDPIKGEDREVVISNKALNGVISDISDHGLVSDSSINGLSLDVARKNAFDGSVWEFHASGTESLFRAENSEANKNTWETSETVIPLFDNKKGRHGDLFVASSETSVGFSGVNLSLDFCSNPSSSMDTNHERNINSVMKKTSSDDDFWEFNGAVPGNGPIFYDKPEDFSNDSAAGKTHGRIECAENLWESGNAISETRSKHEKNKPSWDTKEALPLSLFGDEELENDYHLPIQNDFIIKGDDFTVKGDLERRDRATHATSLTDLIASLYSQPLPNPPMVEVHEATQGGLNSATTGSEQVAVTEDDDFGDWDFHGAGVDIRGGSPGIDEHIQQFSNSELSSTLVSPEATRTNPKSSSNDLYWEYSDVLLPANSAEQSYITTVTPQNPSTKLKLEDLIGFYNSLEGKLRVAAIHHLNNGEIHEDAPLKLHNEEFQELYNELQVSETSSISPSHSGINIDALLEALQGPKFQVLEAEYSLSSRLIMAKKDVNSLGELLKHAALVLRLLRLGTEEEHNRYVSTWFKMISACSKELKHGAIIWRKALEHNLQAQILSKTEGKRFILSLGEIYRVVEVFGVSARFYKPWLLSSADFTGITVLLHECASAWSSSGLENALRNILDPLEFQYEVSVEAIVESIEQVRDLDICALGEMIFASEDPSCRLSLLIPGAMPGMKMVSWNGELYFLKLVNLWTHLVSSEPPELAQIYLRPS